MANCILTPSMICREFMFSVRKLQPSLVLLHADEDAPPPDVSHSYALIENLDVADFLLTLDDFSEKYIMPVASKFADHLVSHEARVTYALSLTQTEYACRHVYDGLSVRARLTYRLASDDQQIVLETLNSKSIPPKLAQKLAEAAAV